MDENNYSIKIIVTISGTSPKVTDFKNKENILTSKENIELYSVKSLLVERSFIKSAYYY